MAGLRIYFPVRELTSAIDAVDKALLDSRRDLLEVLGVQLLSFSQEAYDEKATGAVGDDGIRWAPIQVATVLARLRRAGHLKAKPVGKTKVPNGVTVRPRQRNVLSVTARGAKAASNKDLFDALHAAGVFFHDHKTGKKLAKGKRNKSKALLALSSTAARRNTVDVSGYDIGIDTGLQQAAGTPVYKGNPNQIFDIQDAVVTVGYGMSYSIFFDAKRQLFPDTIPPHWMQELEELATNHCERVAIESLKQSGVS